MKKLLPAVLLMCVFVMSANAQPAADKSLDAAMKNFVASVNRKNTTTFLNYISKTKGLTIMNTIDQGEAGNADKPMFVETIKYTKLAADFKKKGGHYQDIFVKSEYDPNFYDNFSSLKTKWKNVGNNVFMPLDETGAVSKLNFVKWEKQNGRWVVYEVGRMIS